MNKKSEGDGLDNSQNVVVGRLSFHTLKAFSFLSILIVFLFRNGGIIRN